MYGREAARFLFQCRNMLQPEQVQDTASFKASGSRSKSFPFVFPRQNNRKKKLVYSHADAGIFPARATCNGRNAVPCTAGKRRDSCSNAGICRSRSRCRIPFLSRHLGTEASLFRLYSQGRITEKGSRMCHSAPFFFGNIQERN